MNLENSGSRSQIGIVSIATGVYLEHFLKMASSLLSTQPDPKIFHFYLLTDNKWEAEFLASARGLSITTLEIPSFRFPEASLLRYELISEHLGGFSIQEEILVFCDADMEVVGPLNLLELVDPKRPTFVFHPGFWRPNGRARIDLYLRSPLTFLTDCYLTFRFGAIGTWETDKRSSAYVKRKRRLRYVCGAFWFATKSDFFGVCEELTRSIRTDKVNGRLAVWHDESHVNCFVSSHDVGILPPTYCFAVGYPQLTHLVPVVIAVEKKTPGNRK